PSYWEPPLASLPPDHELALHAHAEMPYPPEWWGVDEEEGPPPGYVLLDHPEMADAQLPPIPCVTTNDGCTLEDGAGLAMHDDDEFAWG
ncbi:MAG: hypothetical protein SGPRY_015061, partial [Prymnesium sp.]